MSDFVKPVPRPADEAVTRPFWDAARQHRLVIPRCATCDQFFWWPRPSCPTCLIPDWDWTSVSGRAHLYAYTVVRQPANPAFLADVPYVYALVDLDEGVRMVSNIVGCRIEDIRTEMPLVAAFDEVSPEWTLVRFRPD